MNSSELGVLNDANEIRYQCDLEALDTVQRKRRAELAAEVWHQSLEMRELTTGFEFRFNFSPALLNNIAELAILEHLCCPFFDITLKLERDKGPLWLQITGGIGVKEFLKAEMNL